MSRDDYELWRKARFALQPIKTFLDLTEMELEFWWLPAGTIGEKGVVDKPSIDKDMKSFTLGCKLFDCVSDPIIRSGQVIAIRTTVPVTRPLPSFDILEMQWQGIRVVALSGLINEPDDIEEEEESDDDLSEYDYSPLT
ncbi:hypothetical protein BDV12DRAFT_195148 [Aspergillus spectabilis]